MTQTTTDSHMWYPEMDHLSGIATISLTNKEGLGALHLRLQVNDQETRFMFSAQDFSRFVTGKMIRGFERDNFDESAYPIIAKRLGDWAIFEVYGTHSFFCRFSDIKDLWSFDKTSVLISGEKTMKRTETILHIAKNAMMKIATPDRVPCKKIVGA